MKKNENQTSFLNMGTSSLLVTFLILCLAIFATLSLSGAKSDYDYSVQLASQKKAYYEACSVSELTLAHLDNILKEQHSLCDTAQDYFDKIIHSLDNEIKHLSIQQELIDDSLILSWVIPFTESKSLSVSVAIPYKITDQDNYYRVLTWQTMPND